MPLENVDQIRVSGKEEGAFSYHPSKRYRDFYLKNSREERLTRERKLWNQMIAPPPPPPHDTSLLINE